MYDNCFMVQNNEFKIMLTYFNTSKGNDKNPQRQANLSIESQDNILDLNALFRQSDVYIESLRQHVTS